MKWVSGAHSFCTDPLVQSLLCPSVFLLSIRTKKEKTEQHTCNSTLRNRKEWVMQPADFCRQALLSEELLSLSYLVFGLQASQQINKEAKNHSAPQPRHQRRSPVASPLEQQSGPLLVVKATAFTACLLPSSSLSYSFGSFSKFLAGHSLPVQMDWALSTGLTVPT